jgi:RNA polymerase sigma-70 factor, ECF subfamily
MDDDLAEVVRVEGGRVLATLIRFTGDFDLAEDAVHDAVLAAIESWPQRGRPANPGAWLTTTARHKALDRIRREQLRPRNEQAARLLSDPAPPIGDEATIRDDQLRLIFTCCHPALSSEARLALTLRTVCGLTTAEIAHVHLVSETTMAQRISRAKRKIAVTHIPYRVPDDHELPSRLPSVLATVYAVFTSGHHPSVGSLTGRLDLATEGVRLARLLHGLMPDEPECAGLLALTLATHARRDARIDRHGSLVVLEQQDRARWHHDEIGEAAALVERVLARRRPGPFQVQAAIGCLHGLASAPGETDWPQIAELYGLLEQFWPTPVVRINRSIAVAYATDPARGLALLAALPESEVDRWHLYWSTVAELRWRSGQAIDAIVAVQRALACEMNDTDREFLTGKLATYEQGR